MIAISNKQRDAIVRLLDYLAVQPARDTRALNVRRMARLTARQLKAKRPAEAGGEVMYLIGGLDQ